MAKDPTNEAITTVGSSIGPVKGSDAPIMPNIDKLLEFSENIAKSEMFPSIKNKYQALAVVEYGRELGLKPIMALQTIHWIPKKDPQGGQSKQGTMAIESKVLLALAQQNGVEVTVDKKTTKECQLTFSRGKQSFTERFTWADVERAKLDYKKNYITFPEEMLFWRCVSKGLRVFDPGLFLGLYTMEEVEAGTEQVTLEVEPKKEEQAIQAEIVEEEEEKPEKQEAPKKKTKPKAKKTAPPPQPSPEVKEETEEEEQQEEDKTQDTNETPPEEMTDQEKAEYYTEAFKEDFYIRFGPDQKKVDTMFRQFKEFLEKWQENRSKPRLFVKRNKFGHLSMKEGKGSDIDLAWQHRSHVLKEWSDWEKAQKDAAEDIANTDVEDLS